MTDDDSSQPRAASAPYSHDETRPDGDSDFPPILLKGLNHEELSWSISDRLGVMEAQVTALAARMATLDANVQQVRDLLVGIGGLLRTPSGISAGNVVVYHQVQLCKRVGPDPSTRGRPVIGRSGRTAPDVEPATATFARL